MAAEEDTNFAYHVPKKVFENFVVPEDLAHVQRNHKLQDLYSTMGEYINIGLDEVAANFSRENMSSQIDDIKGTIKKMTVDAQKMINAIGEKAFPLPPEFFEALQYLDIPWPPAV